MKKRMKFNLRHFQLERKFTHEEILCRKITINLKKYLKVEIFLIISTAVGKIKFLIRMDLHNKERLRRKKKRRKMKFSWLYEKLSVIFHNFSGHQLSNLSSFNDFTKLLNSEVDAASLGIGRAMFGEFEFTTKILYTRHFQNFIAFEATESFCES